MSVFEHRSRIDASAEDVFAWFERPGAFERLTPPWERMTVVERTGGITDGARAVLRVSKGPVSVRWVAVHSAYEPGRGFRDEQVSGPLKRWVHTHGFEPDGGEASWMSDSIDYELPLSPLSRPADALSVRPMLARQFAYRHDRVRADIARHRAVAGRAPQRFVISGASGFIASALIPFLTTGGHRIDRLVRSRPEPGSTDIHWDITRGEIDAEALEGADVVIHFAGEPIASGRWTPEVKERIRASRVDGTTLLARTLAGLRKPPRVLLSASAIGYYGDRGDEDLTEDAPPGDGFLPDVCVAWEASTEAAEHAGIRVVHMRTGIVLSPAGGALAKMLLPFKLGAGGRIGTGRQYMSWISMDDHIGAIHHLALGSELSGPVNMTAPKPVRNTEFAKTLASALRRPAVVPLPAFAVKLAFGEMGEHLLLDSARVLPSRLEQDGFTFLAPDLRSALRAELGR